MQWSELTMCLVDQHSYSSELSLTKAIKNLACRDYTTSWFSVYWRRAKTQVQICVCMMGSGGAPVTDLVKKGSSIYWRRLNVTYVHPRQPRHMQFSPGTAVFCPIFRTASQPAPVYTAGLHPRPGRSQCPIIPCPSPKSLSLWRYYCATTSLTL